MCAFVSLVNAARLEADIQDILTSSEARSAQNMLKTTIALNYGSRQEIALASQKVAQKVMAGLLDANTITADTISEHLLILQARPILIFSSAPAVMNV